MSIQTSLLIYGGDNPYWLVVEPWANQYEILPNDKCRLVAFHPTQQVIFSVELQDQKCLIVYVNSSGSTYEFYKNDELFEG
jgi:hypothetical protein